MSSPPRDKVEVKGGHLPAVKAGGMRIVKKHQSAVTPPTLEKDKDIEGWENTSPKQPPRVVISGALTRGDKDFPPAAAQVAHQKPQPGVEKLPPAHCMNQTIHQPRK